MLFLASSISASNSASSSPSRGRRLIKSSHWKKERGKWGSKKKECPTVVGREPRTISWHPFNGRVPFCGGPFYFAGGREKHAIKRREKRTSFFLAAAFSLRSSCFFRAFSTLSSCLEKSRVKFAKFNLRSASHQELLVERPPERAYPPALFERPPDGLGRGRRRRIDLSSDLLLLLRLLPVFGGGRGRGRHGGSAGGGSELHLRSGSFAIVVTFLLFILGDVAERSSAFSNFGVLRHGLIFNRRGCRRQQ